MKHQSIPVLIMILFQVSCTNQKDVLIKIVEGDYDEVGVKSGYVNQRGDTIIPPGKYDYCYTDTFQHYAIVMKHGGPCIAIDRNEKELYEVYWFDNGPDYIQEGLFRIRKNGKIGFANEKGQISIEPQYECATPFKNGKAKVSYHCRLIPNGEHTRMESNDWFYIDRHGKKVSE